jgi:hypothetical protein
MANVEGKATAITVMTPLKRQGPLVLLAVFWAARNITSTLETLQQLSFIHYARWAVIDSFPDAGEGEKLSHEYLLFESNFNGTWDQYIDAFAEVIAVRMKAIWGTSYGFPGPIPVNPFKDYIRRNEYVANHYWSAYPGFTTTEIVSAQRVETALTEFQQRATKLTPEAFKTAYESLLTSIQHDL